MVKILLLSIFLSFKIHALGLPLVEVLEVSNSGRTVILNIGEYEGEFKDDKKHGKGIFTFLDGQKYVGEFKDDKKHGKGVLIFPNGDKYSGEWKNDEFIG